jgi:hypothetical protein
MSSKTCRHRKDPVAVPLGWAQFPGKRMTLPARQQTLLFANQGIPQMSEYRHRHRESLYHHARSREFISGAILYDETSVRQSKR